MPSWDLALQRVMRRLPIALVSGIGGGLARLKIRFIDPEVANKARRNIRQHFPDMPDAQVERIVWRFADNIGRLMAEFAVIHRFDQAKRIQLVGVEVARADVGKVPTSISINGVISMIPSARSTSSPVSDRREEARCPQPPR